MAKYHRCILLPENMLVVKMIMAQIDVHMLKQDSDTSAYKKNATYILLFILEDWLVCCKLYCTLVEYGRLDCLVMDWVEIKWMSGPMINVEDLNVCWWIVWRCKMTGPLSNVEDLIVSWWMVLRFSGWAAPSKTVTLSTLWYLW